VLGLALVVFVESIAVVWLWLRRDRLDTRWLTADTVFCAAAVVAGAKVVPASASHSWAFFMYPFSLLVCVGIGAGYRRLWQAFAGAATPAAGYLVAAFAVLGDPGWNAGPNALSYLGNALVTWLIARETRRSGRVADSREAEVLARAAELAREREAARYTRVLHDRVLQTLEMLARGAWLTDLAVRAQVMGEAAWLREVVAGGPPEGADDILSGLRAVVQDQARRGVHAQLNAAALHPPPRRRSVPPHVTEAICGAVREALTNVGKHAGVDEAVVRAVLDRDATVLRVSVVDQGKGFEPRVAAAGPGTGLAQSIRARIAQVGGSTAVHSTPGGGTEVEMSVPLTARQPDPAAM
jgi:signal transduction histidine kinase